MGAGKTTVAKALAEQKNLPSYDTDDLIVAQCGKSIPEIFAQDGESYFRQIETKCLATTGAFPRSVIATGGGLVLNPENVALIRKFGILIYLDTPFSLCYERICSDKNRPNAATRTKEELLKLYRTREEIYREVCDFSVVCSNDLELIKKDILALCP